MSDERELCPDCDLPLATQQEFDTTPEGEDPPGLELCWSRWSNCPRPRIDWRARALEAEARAKASIDYREGRTTMDDAEIKRLVCGLEAFAYATGVSPEAFHAALRAVVGRDVQIDVVSPYLPLSATPPTPGSPPRKLSWVDQRGVERAWIDLIGETWRWEAYNTAEAHNIADERLLSGETVTFLSAYEKVTAALGGKVSTLAVKPAWSRS